VKLKKLAVAVGLALNARLERYMSRTGLLLSALPLVVDKAGLEKVPEAQRTLYVEKDGKYRLDVDGVEDTSGLKSALEKEREARKNEEKARKEFEKRFEGIDPDKTRQLMAQFEDADEANLIKEGKAGIDKIIEKRTAKLRQEFEKKLEEASAGREGALEVAGTFMDKVLENQVRAAATKAGLHPSAVDDAIIRAMGIFSIDDDGNAVQLDDEENIILGKDGKTPFSLEEWMGGMRESAPHWFPASSSGGGAHGGKGGGAGGKTMKRAAFEALSPTEKAAAMKEKTTLVD